jgi:hypothetical protein
MGLREEIVKKIRSAEVRPFDNIRFEKDTVYLRELPAEKLKYGYSTTIEMIIVMEEQNSNLYETLKGEIGTHGIYGSYFVQLITYGAESPVLALDNLWIRKTSLKIIWEG